MKTYYVHGMGIGNLALPETYNYYAYDSNTKEHLAHAHNFKELAEKCAFLGYTERKELQ